MLKKNIKLHISLKSFHPYYLNRFILLIQKSFIGLNLIKNQQNFEKKQIERFTVLRSPHVDKKARDQFERITYYRKICIEFQDNINTKMLYKIIQHLSTIALGVNLKITYKK